MNHVKRILIEVVRRPVRNILIALSVFLLSGFCCAGTFLEVVIRNFQNAFAEVSGYCLHVEAEGFKSLSDWQEVLKKAEEYPYIVAYNNAFEQMMICDPVNFQNVSYDGIVHQNDPYSNVYLYGYVDISCQDYFRNGRLELVRGEFPSEENQGVLIDQNLADVNGLTIGSELVLQYGDTTATMTVTGMYHAIQTPQTEQMNGYYENAQESFLYCDYGSYVQFTGQEEISALDFYVDEYAHMEVAGQFMENCIQGVENSFVANTMKGQEVQMAHVFQLINRLASVILTGTYIAAVFIMAVLILFWMRSHRRSVAIYRILGMPPAEILSNLVGEVLLISILPMTIMYKVAEIVCSKYAAQLFNWLMGWCGASLSERTFATDNWRFRYEITDFLQKLGCLELIILGAVVVYGGIYLKSRVIQMTNQ